MRARTNTALRFIALLAVLAAIAGSVVGCGDESFEYQVRVTDQETHQGIAYARVTIEGSGAPKDDVTDDNGIARIFVDASNAGKPGRLIVQADNYRQYRINIDLDEATLPKTIPLDRITIPPTAAFVPSDTATPTTPAPIPTTPVPLPTTPVPMPTTPVPMPTTPVPMPTTPVPMPTTPAPLPTPAAEFIKDVTIPDGTRMEPNQQFTKTWRFRNSGPVPWGDEAQLVSVPGTIQGYQSHQMGGPDFVDVPSVAPDETVDVSVNLVAPSTPGRYRSYWRLKLASGEWLDGNHYAEIVVIPFQDFEACNSLADCAKEDWHATPQLCTLQDNKPICVQAESKCPNDTFQAPQGTRALCVDAHAKGKEDAGSKEGGTVRIFYGSDGSIDLCSAQTLSIMVYDTIGNHTVELKFVDENGHKSVGLWTDPQEVSTHCAWTKITWELSKFAPAGPCQIQGFKDESAKDEPPPVDLTRIKAIEIYEWWDGTYCFDDVRYQ